MRLKKHIIEWEVGGFAMMSIKEAEKITGITNQNIRYYEKQGLLAPARRAENSYREYSQEEKARMAELYRS